MNTEFKAVLFDFGGVISSSPFEAFAHYEQANDLPPNLIRSLNTTNPDANAWAHLERNDVSFDEFCSLFEAEALAVGHAVNAAEIMALLAGEVRPAMVEAVRRCHEQLKTALLTNNFVSGISGSDPRPVLAYFDLILESSKAGVRKPDPLFYEMACEQLGIHPTQAVFLDDLGINLKPAKAMGMTTIKVLDPDVAIADLEELLGLALR
ncbi:MAG: HAD-IA family hydrolase [Acidimicrobiales bacterium]